MHAACRSACAAAGLSKQVTVHTLRHTFATHLLESGAHVRIIQVLLGHASLASTARYTRVATKTISNTPSPLDRLRLEVVPPGNTLIDQPWKIMSIARRDWAAVGHSI